MNNASGHAGLFNAIAMTVVLVVVGCEKTEGTVSSYETLISVTAEVMDLELEHAVKTALSKEDMLAGLNIRVSASNGEVSLSGVVRNQAQHNRAVKTAIGIAGVNVIDDKLAVTDQN